MHNGKYRKKPIVIEAFQFEPIPDQSWNPVYIDVESSTGYSINTLEGKHEVTPGDWIIKGVKGETYSCKPDIFAMTYEKVND